MYIYIYTFIYIYIFYLKKSRDSLPFFPMIFGSERSKSRLAKAAGAEPSGQVRDKKLHAVVARTSRSEHVQTVSASEHF